MNRGIRKQKGENLSDTNIEKVIKALSQASPITKTAACEILNISYNTPRLKRIIEEHEEKIEFRANMRKKLRGQPLDVSTLSEIVSSYLSGTSLIDISNATYRSTSVIKNILTRYNIPIRNKAVDYWHPTFISDDAIAEDYEINDLVYAARYNCPATIINFNKTIKYGLVYKIQLHNLRRQTAYQPYYELADLRKVQNELDIEMQDLSIEEVKYWLNEGLKNQKKQDDKRK